MNRGKRIKKYELTENLIKSSFIVKGSKVFIELVYIDLETTILRIKNLVNKEL